MSSRRRVGRLLVVAFREEGNEVTGVLELESGAVTSDQGGAWLLDDFYAVLPSPSGSRRIIPADGEAFLLACWYSLRGSSVWGELEGTDGSPFSRDEGLELVDSYANSVGRPPALVVEGLAAGDSPEQRQAEQLIISALADKLGLSLTKARKRHAGAVVEFDGLSEDPPVLVEAWAHQGRPKSAQRNKVMTDALKMVWGATALFPGRETRKLLALSDPVAAAHFLGTSWMASALRDLGVEVVVVELPAEVIVAVKGAQRRQYR